MNPSAVIDKKGDSVYAQRSNQSYPQSYEQRSNSTTWVLHICINHEML